MWFLLQVALEESRGARECVQEGGRMSDKELVNEHLCEGRRWRWGRACVGIGKKRKWKERGNGDGLHFFPPVSVTCSESQFPHQEF